jgi:lipopolysaccharide biosynthesis glycosyltransferase
VQSLLSGIELISSPHFSFIDKIYGFLNPPYDFNIYMDTDTAVIDDISELFVLLQRFDLAASHGVGAKGRRFNGKAVEGIPECFAEYNTGVVCFRRNNKTHEVFEKWLNLYAGESGDIHDQIAFRKATYQSDLSLYVLPPEYNYLAGMAVLSGKVKIFHSPKLVTDSNAFEAFKKRINQNHDVRLFVPPSKIFTIRRGNS